MQRMGVLRRAGLLGLAGFIGLVTLGGCQADKKKADMATQEAAELRERIATLEQSNRDKDAQLAELQAKGATDVFGADTGTDLPQGRNNRGGDGGNFHREAGRGMVATITDNVLFDSGQATLKPTAKKTLDSIANEIKRKYANNSVRVEGHTDSDPLVKTKAKWGSNENLSQARAEAVRKYLANKGISTSRIEAVGYGSSQPKSSKAASRRVEIVILTS